MSSSASRLDELHCPPSFEGQGMATDDQHKLLNLLATLAYDYQPGKYSLSSGKVSDEYIDCKRALSHCDALPSMGRMILSKIDPRVVAVGGLTMGADPVAFSAARESCGTARSLRWFSVRKEAKKHGRMKLIEGDLSNGDHVAVVDDVVTTGGSTIQAINKCAGEGLRVIQVIVLVDREEDDGMRKVEAAAGLGVQVVALFTKSEIHREWLKTRPSPATASKLCAVS